MPAGRSGCRTTTDARRRTSPRALRDFAADETLLSGVLREVITASEGADALGLLDATVALGRRARLGDADAAEELASLISELDLARTEVLVRALTRWFQLVNLAEDNERVRRLRARDGRDRRTPRPGSIRETIAQLAQAGIGARELQRMLEGSELRLIMIAHPTEARRRTTSDKLARVFGILRELDQVATAEEPDARRRLLATVQELWGSDDLRATSLSVDDEVRGGLIHFASTLADTVPLIYRDIERALGEFYPQASFEVPPVLSFGSWIGGDRTSILALGAEEFPGLAEQLEAINPEEPYRRALTFLRERIRMTQSRRPGAYAQPSELLVDLRLVDGCLAADAGALTAAGDLRDVIRQVEVFGFHFARLDIREHAQVHRRSLSEIFSSLGICERYEAMSEPLRIELLRRHNRDRRPLIPRDIGGFSAPTQETIETFRMLRETTSRTHRGAIQSYIVSGRRAQQTCSRCCC